MPTPSNLDLRGLILQVIQDQLPKTPTSANLQQGSVLNEVVRRLNLHHNLSLEEAVLTEWHDLFRIGYLAWGFNITNPNPPHFHLTDRGRRTIEKLSRDPGNPSGYLKHLSSLSTLNPVANSYLIEGLDCFVSGLYKAAAVMIGAGAESLLLELRDATVEKLNLLGQPVPKNLQDWRVKTVLDSLYDVLDSKKAVFPRNLKDEFESYWAAFAQQIRAVRNDAGHPTSVDPVTPDGVHASFLIFPELARLSARLKEWVIKEFK